MLDADIADIAARSQPLVERIHRAASAAPGLPAQGYGPSGGAPASELVEKRLQAWCRAAAGGDWGAFDRRLAWDGLDLGTARRLLTADASLPGMKEAPPWAQMLRDALLALRTTGVSSEPAPEGTQSSEEPVPFEGILAAFVAAARRRIDAFAGDATALLSREAHAALDRSLLLLLAAHATPTLYFEFALARVQQLSSLDRLAALAADVDDRDLYDRFVREMCGGGLLALFREYPVLARLLSTVALLRAEAYVEFLRRLAADWELIQRVLADGRELGRVTSLQTALSDPHRGQRDVMIVTFASGLKVVYKPKDLGTEDCFNRLLVWLTERSAPLPLRALRVLDRNTYGWVEFAEHAPCADGDAARRYYQRAGMLLCLLYALEGTDCHFQNIVACGEDPVLIDCEMLLHHRMPDELAGALPAKVAAGEQMSRSVLRTGLLPSWLVGADGRAAFDVSGLAGPDDRDVGTRLPRWRHVNTDRMVGEYEPQTLRATTNVPVLDGVPLRLEDYASDVASGFRAMYTFLYDQRDALLARGGPLDELLRQRVRIVYRPTRLYERILMLAREPDCLRDGVDRGVQLEQLARSMAMSLDRPVLWPILTAEEQAMEQGDIPFFTARADSEALELPGGTWIGGAFAEPSAALVRAQLASLGEGGLHLQLGFIQAALQVWFARETATGSRVSGSAAVAAPASHSGGGISVTPAGQPIMEVDIEPVSADELVNAASAIADEIRARAIVGSDGNATWIAPQLLMEAGRYQLQPVGDGLYDGACGIGLFLAALAAVTSRARDRDWALRAVAAVRTAIRERGEQLPWQGIGAGPGVGGIVYALTRIGRLVGEPALLDDARTAAGMMTADRITADRSFDVLLGAAGAILGLLAAYTTTGDGDLLGQAVACGRHLLDTRVASMAGPRAWARLDGRLLAGFSHGAAGIAYTLVQLYEMVGEPAFLDAAMEGVAYEDGLFSSEHGNWPDLRSEPVSFPVQWCHGASGIGLARLGGLAVLDTPQIRRDIEAAVGTTIRAGLHTDDHLCCGTMGRVELLLEAGRTLGRADLTARAVERASRVVQRARSEGAYRTNPRSVFCPGLFQGTAGIGLQLLRIADPDTVPSALLWR